VLRKASGAIEDAKNATKFLSSDPGVQPIIFGDRVKVVAGDDAGKVYSFMGKSGSFTPTTENYRDKGSWLEVPTTRAIPDFGNLRTWTATPEVRAAAPSARAPAWP